MMSRRDVKNVLGQSTHAFEVMSAPLGPRKMARAVAACEKAAANWKGHFRRPPPLTTLEKLKAIQADLDVGSYLEERNGLVVRPKVNIDHAQRAQLTNAVGVADTPSQEEQPSKAQEETRPASPLKSHPNPPNSSATHHRSRNSRMLLVGR